MHLTFSKNYKLVRTSKPTPEYPKGDPKADSTYKVTPQDGSTFDDEAIIVGTQESRSPKQWTPVSTIYVHRYKSEHLNQPKHQIGTWIDSNEDGVVDVSEVRSFDNRIGDVNRNKAGNFSTLTLDLNPSQGENGTWYINEQLGVLS